MILLTCEKVSLGYGSRVVVKDLSFTVRAGDYFCIVGENGAGKSTLVKTLLGLQRPLGGKISLNVAACFYSKFHILQFSGRKFAAAIE